IVQMRQTFEPVQAAAGGTSLSGFRRKLEIDGVPSGSEVRLRVLPHHDLAATRTGQTWQVTGLRGNPRVSIVLPQDAQMEIRPDRPWLMLRGSDPMQTLV